MDLSYEETMKRIEKYENESRAKGNNHSYCKEVKFPYYVNVFKGENKIIVSPQINSIGWYYINMAWNKATVEISNPLAIGSMIFEALKHISESWVDARTPAERKEDSIYKIATNCRTYKAFNKLYDMCTVVLEEDQTLVFSPAYKIEEYKGYCGSENKQLIYMNPTKDPVEIGNAVLKCFAFTEKNKFVPEFEVKHEESFIETLSGNKVKYILPDEERYADEEDFHSAEIYQGYSYSPEDSDERSAYMYFSIAPELNNDISEESVIRAFKNEYGEPEKKVYEIFKGSFNDCYYDITGSGIRKISYIKRIDEDEVLACELIINIKKLDLADIRRTIADFDYMARSCEFV